jgi:hypothetical protein
LVEDAVAWGEVEGEEEEGGGEVIIMCGFGVVGVGEFCSVVSVWSSHVYLRKFKVYTMSDRYESQNCVLISVGVRHCSVS